MKIHNPILLNFVAYKAQVTHKGRRVDLKGIYHQVSLQSMSRSSVKHLIKKSKIFWAHLFTISTTGLEEKEVVPTTIIAILDQFADTFNEPKALPPRRQHDHFIH